MKKPEHLLPIVQAGLYNHIFELARVKSCLFLHLKLESLYILA